VNVDSFVEKKYPPPRAFNEQKTTKNALKRTVALSLFGASGY